MGVSKGEHPFGRLNEGSPEGGEIRNLPPPAGSLLTFLPEQESKPPEACRLPIQVLLVDKHPSTVLEAGPPPLRAGEVFLGTGETDSSTTLRSAQNDSRGNGLPISSRLVAADAISNSASNPLLRTISFIASYTMFLSQVVFL